MSAPPPPDPRRDPKVIVLAGIPAVLIGAALVWWLHGGQVSHQEAFEELEARAQADRAAQLDAGADTGRDSE